MTVLDYEGPVLSNSLVDLFSLIPSWQVGVGILCSAIAALFYDTGGEIFQKKAPGKRGFWDPVFLPSLIYAGVFIAAYRFIDEVAVNLEHPYNLFHYGRFSMSSQSMVDGTVELLFYFLHLPFAVNQKTLVLGNFLICFVTGWLHLVLLWRFWFSEVNSKNKFLLAVFALHAPFAGVLASGFGNGLVSLLFLASMSFYMKGKKGASILMSALIALVRPDGILVSFACALVCLADGFIKKELKLRDALAAVFLPLLAMGIYFAVFHQLYGHWVPTPVLFKAVRPGMLPMFYPGNFINAVLGEWLKPSWFVLYLMLGLAWCFRLDRHPRAGKVLKTVSLYILALTPCFLFYQASDATLEIRAFGTQPRYWISFSAAVLAGTLLVISVWEDEIADRYASPTMSFFMFLAFSILCAGGLSEIRKAQDSGYFFRGYPAVAGSFADRVFPSAFRFSTPEMNTFGLASERPVIDLMGYSNREIASSKVCSNYRIRSLPEFFLKEKPEVCWLFWISHSPELYNYQTAENALLEDSLAKNGGNALGDLNEVVKQYDLLMVRDSGYQAGFLIRRDAVEETERALAAAGFSRKASRPLGESFNLAYNQQELVQHACA